MFKWLYCLTRSINWMFLRWISDTMASWHEMAFPDAIKLSCLPRHHGHMWEICWEKSLAPANSSLVTRNLFVFLVVVSGQNCAKTLLTVDQHRWLCSSAQGITCHSLIYNYRYFHRIHRLSWVIEVQHKALTICWLPVRLVPKSSSMVHARRVAYSSTVLISQMFSSLPWVLSHYNV